MTEIPLIDDRIKTVGPTYLRTLNAQALKKLNEMLIVTDTNSKPRAVIFPYDQYMAMQKELVEGRQIIERLNQTTIVFDRQVFDAHDHEVVLPGNYNPPVPLQGVPTVQVTGNFIQNPDTQHSHEAPLKPRCLHCQEPSEQSPCSSCFSKGHRGVVDRCMKCGEEKEARRRASKDSTGTAAERDNVDYLAFDQEVS